MTHHEVRLNFANDIDQLEFGIVIQIERVVAQIEELNVMHVKGLGGVFRFAPAFGFDFVQSHAFLFPKLGAFAAFAK